MHSKEKLRHYIDSFARSRVNSNTFPALIREWVEVLRKRRPFDDDLDAIVAAEPPDGLALYEHMTARGLAPLTISTQISRLRSLYRFLRDCGLVPVIPFALVPRISMRRVRPTEAIEFSKLAALIDAPTRGEPRGDRDRAILALLIGSGLRISELTGIRLCDLGRSGRGNRFVYLPHTKSRQEQNQPIPTWAWRLVAIWLMRRRAAGARGTDRLFVSINPAGEHKKRLTEANVRKFFADYARKAGISNRVTPHSCRATGITKLLSDGVGYREVQEFSRHATIHSVEIYDKRRIGIDENVGLKIFSRELKKVR